MVGCQDVCIQPNERRDKTPVDVSHTQGIPTLRYRLLDGQYICAPHVGVNMNVRWFQNCQHHPHLEILEPSSPLLELLSVPTSQGRESRAKKSSGTAGEGGRGGTPGAENK